MYMRVPLKKMLENMGIRHVMVAYETYPWVHYDDDTDTTCSAEVRMGPDGDTFEAEVQFLKDEDDGKNDESQGESGRLLTPPSQKFYMRGKAFKDNIWSPTYASLEKEDYTNKVAEWEEKCCNFFRACIQAMQMGQMPDIEAIAKQEFPEEWGGGGRRGKIGRKSPKVKPGQLLGIKKPGA